MVKTNAVGSKKSAKKASRKRASSAKKSSSHKKVSVKRAPSHQHFILKDGSRLDHYLALADVLETMERDVLDYHVNELKNDFATWVEDVFKEHELAAALRKAKSAKGMRMVIYKHLIDTHLK